MPTLALKICYNDTEQFKCVQIHSIWREYTVLLILYAVFVCYTQSTSFILPDFNCSCLLTSLSRGGRYEQRI